MASTNYNDRRNFIKKASLGGLMTLGIPQIVSEAFAAEKVKKIALKKEDIILFQGDSITDAGRKKEEEKYNNATALGTGYAFLAASKLLYHHADKGLKIYNKGISGNKVYQLAERWDADCLDIKPNVLSILIRVNDHWYAKKDYTGTLKTYQDDYQTLLDRTKQKLSDVKLIIGEPFGVAGIPGNYEKWDPVFDDFCKTAREIDIRTTAQIQIQQELIENYLTLYPHIKILDHNQVAKKDCPCFDVPKFCKLIGVPTDNIYSYNHDKIIVIQGVNR